MNIIDKVIGWVSPQRAYERQAYRDALRQYDAASMDRLSSDWQPAYGTAEQLATGSRDIIRGRARAAEMNSDLAESAVIALLTKCNRQQVLYLKQKLEIVTVN